VTLSIAIAITLCMAAVHLAVALCKRGPKWLVWLDRVAAAAVGLLALTMLSQWGRTPAPSITWPPGTDSTSLSYGSPGIYLAVIALVSLAVSRLASLARPPGTAGSAAWTYAMCGLTVLALTVDQFLLRYVILEFVALGTLIALLSTLPSSERLRALPRLFLLFRLGDVVLLAAILLLQGLSGTFAIDAMIQRGAEAAGPQRTALLFCALLAVAVKTGLPPFQVWMEKAWRQPRPQRIWTTALGLPVLGAYLIYRIKPILVAAGMLTPLALAGALLLVLSIWRALRAHQTSAQMAWWSAGHSAVAPLALAADVMPPYLLAYVPIRIALACVLEHSASRAEAARPEAGGLEGLFGWLGSAADTIETRVLEPTNTRLAALLWNLAQRTRQHAEKGLEAINATVAALLWRLAHLARDTGETGLEALNANIVIQGRSVAETVHAWHQGRLRSNLLWATCALVVVIILVLAFT